MYTLNLTTMDAQEGLYNCAVNYANIKKGEKALILTDTKSDHRIAEGFANLCSLQGAEPIVVIMKTLPLPHHEPPLPIAEAMKVADITVAPLYYSISHTKARYDARALGKRFLGIYVESLDAFATEGARFPAEIIFAVAKKVSDQWKRGKTIHITCDKGTDLKAKILKPEYISGWEGSTAPLGSNEGGVKRPFGNFAGGFGVVGMWPAWTSEGVIYFDAVHTFKGRVKTPLKFIIKGGRVVDMEGEPEHVEFFRGVFKKFGENANHHAELMIGLNPKARINLEDPTHLEAHRRAGALHSAVGNQAASAAFKNQKDLVFPGFHLDNYLQKPTIRIDDEVCVDRGKLQVYYHDPEILALLQKHGVSLEEKEENLSMDV